MARMQILETDGDGVEEESNVQEDGTTPLVWVNNQPHKYNNTGKEIVRVRKQAGTADMTVETFAPDQYGLVLPDRVIAIAANTTVYFKPFSREAHNERSGADKDYTSLAFSNITGLEVAVIRLGDE